MNTKTKREGNKKFFILLASIFILFLIILIFSSNKKSEISPQEEIKNPEKKIETEKTQKKVEKEQKNNPPFINNLKFKFENVENKNVLTVSVEGSDADNDPIIYNYEWKKNDEVVGNDDRLSDFKKGDKITVKVIPFDGKEEGTPKSISIEIANLPPIIMENNEVVEAKNIIRYQVKAYDPEGDPLLFSFLGNPENAKIDEKTGLIEYKPTPEKPKQKFDVKVSDQQGGEATYSFELGYTEEKNTEDTKQEK